MVGQTHKNVCLEWKGKSIILENSKQVMLVFISGAKVKTMGIYLSGKRNILTS